MDTTNQMPQMPQNNPSMGSIEPHKKSYGALIAVVVILFLIVIGGLYFLGQRIDQPYINPTTTGGDEMTNSFNSQSDSDDVTSIEADLNATNIDNVDQGAAATESEIQ